METIVKALRLKLGLSQDELARMIPVHPVVLSKWERGVAKVHPRLLPLLAQALGVSVKELESVAFRRARR